MIAGQKKINITYMAEVFDKEDNACIEGETCMDVQLAEEYADLLLQDKEDVRKLGRDAILKREYALESLKIIIDHNERLKNRTFVSGSITGIEEIKDW